MIARSEALVADNSV